MKKNCGLPLPNCTSQILRDAITYERVILGRYSPHDTEPGKPPQVQEGFGCEKILVPWFDPPASNSPPAPVTEVEQTAES